MKSQLHSGNRSHVVQRWIAVLVAGALSGQVMSETHTGDATSDAASGEDAAGIPELITYLPTSGTAEALEIRAVWERALESRLMPFDHSAPVTVNVDVLLAECLAAEPERQSDSSITLHANLLGEEVTLTTTTLHKIPGSCLWYLDVAQGGPGGTNLALNPNTSQLSGAIRTDNAEYQLAPTAVGEIHILVRLKPGASKRLRDDTPPVPDVLPKDDQGKARSDSAWGVEVPWPSEVAVADSDTQVSSLSSATVRVLILFSNHVNNAADATNRIATRTTQVFGNSAAGLVQFQWVSGPTIAVSGDGPSVLNLDPCEVRNRLRLNVSDLLCGVNIHSLRNAYGADVVVLITRGTAEDRDGCATQMPTTNGNSEYGYAVLVESVLPFIVAPHEIGHVFGLQHESASNVFSYGHAYSDSVRNFATAMHTASDPCISCLTIDFFSDPDGLYNGYPRGTTTKDNVRVLEQTARSSLPTGTLRPRRRRRRRWTLPGAGASVTTSPVGCRLPPAAGMSCTGPRDCLTQEFSSIPASRRQSPSV